MRPAFIEGPLQTRQWSHRLLGTAPDWLNLEFLRCVEAEEFIF